MEFIEKGICAPKGFSASGVHCGIRKNKTKRDLCLIASDTLCNAAAVYTQNLVKGAPIIVTQNNLKKGVARAIICNSGNANTCNSDGEEVAEKMCNLAAQHLSNSRQEALSSQIIVASTGVIGQKLSIEPIEKGMPQLVNDLSISGSQAAADAIMTTDTFLKEIALKFEIDNKICHIGAIGKGSGMIHPNMATMLIFITTDVNISTKMLNKALLTDTQNTFNMISVDGDTSTNDMVAILANGQAKNAQIINENKNYNLFCKALNTVTQKMCKLIASDGEGATKLLECQVNSAKTDIDAKLVAKSVISSSLFKAAMFGSDANWGRILCAIGYSKANVDINKIDVYFKSDKGTIKVCESGKGIDFNESIAKEILSEKEIQIIIDLNIGKFNSTAWGCDLTYDYVKINGDYRS